MNLSFLEAVATDLLAKHGNNLARLVVVFPNKRASLFLNEHLARKSQGPLWSPTYKTIRQLFCENSSRAVADDIKLVADLHRVYCQCTGSTETLDRFYGWGQLMLADFDDVDKNRASADEVFRNVTHLHELDDTSYLTDEQRQVLQRFFSHFSPENDTELKRRFLCLWQHLGEIYHRYNAFLQTQGLAYEGALYREVAEGELDGLDADGYIFVGFNLLQGVERLLFQRLAQEGRAWFYWDFDRHYIQNTACEAGHYIRQHLEVFPNELDTHDDALYNNLRGEKHIRFISASTETLQARYVGEWLKTDGYIQAGRRTAVVLCDEGLLQTVVYSLPPEVENVNITTGFPLAQSPVHAFVVALIALQTAGRVDGTDQYRLHYIHPVLRHPYARFVSEESSALLARLEENHIYYPERDELTCDEQLSLLFQDVEQDANGRNGFHVRLLQWLLEVLRLVGHGAQQGDDPLLKEAVFRMYTLLNRLADLVAGGDLDVDLSTLQRLLMQLVQTSSIPFHGEPVVGVQVMGVLETRNLDFDNLLILSCNEGNMPRGVNDASFIPYALRKAHGLTTVDHKVAIYSYYFHRLLQRAGNITILYNHSTEDGHTGEMSRFMLQWMVESGHHIERLALQAGQTPSRMQPQAVEKNADVMSALLRLQQLSPTALNRYLRCPVQFFYNTVAGIKEADAETEEIDNRTFGNIFHRCSQWIYEELMDASQQVTAEGIARLVEDQWTLQRIVDRAFNEELFKVADHRTRPPYNGLQLINRSVIISYLHQLLEIDRRLAPFKILGLERRVEASIEVQAGDQRHRMVIGGVVDRIDEVQHEGGCAIRVVDYKTGRVPTQRVGDLEAIFSTQNISARHTDYYLQAFLYSTIVRSSPEWNINRLPVSPALLFIQHASRDDYDPVLSLGKERVEDVEVYRSEFWERLHTLLNEIFNPRIPFTPTPDRRRCEHCSYRPLCER